MAGGSCLNTAGSDNEVEDEDESEIDVEEVENSFFSLLIDKLLTLHKAKDKAVRSVHHFKYRGPFPAYCGVLFRFRVCQLVAKLFSNAIDECCIVFPERVDRIQQAMLLRLHDKVGKSSK